MYFSNEVPAQTVSNLGQLILKCETHMKLMSTHDRNIITNGKANNNWWSKHHPDSLYLIDLLYIIFIYLIDAWYG